MKLIDTDAKLNTYFWLIPYNLKLKSKTNCCWGFIKNTTQFFEKTDYFAHSQTILYTLEPINPCIHDNLQK